MHLSSQVAFFLFLSVSVYTVLPLSMAWALMVGIGTSLSHIIIISVYVPVTSPETPDLAVQVKTLISYINSLLFIKKYMMCKHIYICVSMNA